MKVNNSVIILVIGSILIVLNANFMISDFDQKADQTEIILNSMGYTIIHATFSPFVAPETVFLNNLKSFVDVAKANNITIIYREDNTFRFFGTDKRTWKYIVN